MDLKQRLRSRRNTSLKIFLLALAFLLQPTNARATGPHFDHVIFVVFENTDYVDAVAEPNFAAFAKSGAIFTQAFAEVHPSQPNYIALTSGSTKGVFLDFPVDLKVEHIGDLLEAKGLTWKAYAEDYPGNCYTGSAKKSYVRKHVPFISYVNIQSDRVRCAKITGEAEFATDVSKHTLPNYSLYIPNIKNDGHDTGVAYADQWFGKTFGPLLADPAFMKDTLVVVTFDESASTSPNQIYTAFAGAGIKSGTVVNDSINHLSLLRMVEDNWALGNLGKDDVTATQIPNIFP